MLGTKQWEKKKIDNISALKDFAFPQGARQYVNAIPCVLINPTQGKKQGRE